MDECVVIVALPLQPIVVEIPPAEVVVLEVPGTNSIVLEVLRQPVEISLPQTELVQLDIGVQGPVGPQGPPGPTGASGGTLGEDKFRFCQELSGIKNGTNLVFTLPNLDKARHSITGHQIQIFVNGQFIWRDCLGVTESGGVGTGFDTITFVPGFIPIASDTIWANYVLL